MADFRPDFRSPSGDLPDGYNDLPVDERCRVHAERVRLLHVYGARSWHDDVSLVGNRNALLVLRDAIDEALDPTNAAGLSETRAMASDGEGFGIAIQLNDLPWESPAWEAIGLPYADPVARGDGTPDPDWLIRRLRFALKDANAKLVKRGVKPVVDPTITELGFGADHG